MLPALGTEGSSQDATQQRSQHPCGCRGHDEGRCNHSPLGFLCGFHRPGNHMDVFEGEGSGRAPASHGMWLPHEGDGMDNALVTPPISAANHHLRP